MHGIFSTGGFVEGRASRNTFLYRIIKTTIARGPTNLDVGGLATGTKGDSVLYRWVARALPWRDGIDESRSYAVPDKGSITADGTTATCWISASAPRFK